MAFSRGAKALEPTPGGKRAVVLAPHSSHGSVCRRYSVTSGSTGGTSVTWSRRGFGSLPWSFAAHRSQVSGVSSMIRLTFSAGRSDLVSDRWSAYSVIDAARRQLCWAHLWPGWPPRLRPEGLLFGRAATFGGSDEGGFEELREFIPSLASSSATRASSSATCALSARFSSASSS